MSDRKLADLVYDGAIAAALECAATYTPEAIRNQLFRDDDRHLQDEASCDVFLRAWFSSLESPFLRAEAADWFTGAYTTELAPVPNAEYIGAYIQTQSLRDVIARVVEIVLGPELKDLENTPEHPLSAESAEQWRAVGKVLAALDLPPAVVPVAPEKS